jgi:hypothetical protein
MEINVIDEHYPGKVVGIHNEESCANKLSEKLIKEGGFLVEHISIVSPEDTDFEHKLEPDSKGIGQTVLRSHLILGFGCSVVGLIIAGVLITIGPAFATSSPVMMLSAAAILGAFIGLLIAGAISIRPDHEQPINSARHATHHHQWSVVVQTKDHHQIEKAKKIMQPLAIKLSESF